jgi:AICAR transformylase/IMP cyclohydrolase PurH
LIFASSNTRFVPPVEYSSHGGILADRDKEHHLEQLREQHIDLIDMVVVNLYPFQQTVAQVVTCLKFLAAALNIVGPPISIFSTASVSVTSG